MANFLRVAVYGKIEEFYIIIKDSQTYSSERQWKWSDIE